MRIVGFCLCLFAAAMPADGWIVGFGYQARGLEEGRPPTSAELDRVSAERPVLVVDSSGHLGAASAAAFKAARSWRSLTRA